MTKREKQKKETIEWLQKNYPQVMIVWDDYSITRMFESYHKWKLKKSK